MKKHVIYSRKSKYTGKGESVENQIEMCKQKILTKFPDISENSIIILSDEGFTGANINRPSFQKMMKLVKDNKVLSITCYRLDRISRNVGDFCNTITELQKYNVSFLSIREDFDTSTPMGKAMMLICSVFAQLERDTIAERIRDNMIELAKTGRWLGGNTPTGYKSTEVKTMSIDGKLKKLFKLEPIEEEKKLVLLLKDKYKEIKSQTGLETYTIINNIKTKKNKMFTRWTLANILSNPVYARADEDSFRYFTKLGAQVIGNINEYNGKYGLMVYNKTNQISGIGKKDNPITDWIVAVGKHDPFYTGLEYIEIQELLKNGANKRFRKPPVNNALLSGILKCEFCGSYMRPKVYKKSSNQIKFSYLCSLKEKSKGKLCNHHNLNGNIADKLLTDIIKNLKKDNDIFYKEIKKLASNNLTNEEKKKNELIILEQKIKKNEKDIKALVDKIKIVKDEIVPIISEEISSLKNKNQKLVTSINNLKTKKNNTINNEEEIVIDILDNYFNNFDKLDLIEKRNLVKLVVESAYSNGDNLTINLIGADFPSGDNCK